MVEKRDRDYIPICDICGTELNPGRSWDAAELIMRSEDWIKDDDMDICEECQEGRKQ